MHGSSRLSRFETWVRNMKKVLVNKWKSVNTQMFCWLGSWSNIWKPTAPRSQTSFLQTQAFIIHTGKMLLSWSGSCCFLHLTHKLEASLWDLRKPVIWKTIKKMERKNVLLEERGSDSAVVDLCWLFQSLPWPDVQSLPRFMFESLCWWFMFTGKERRPTLEPCGTPHVTPPDLPASAPVLRLLKGGKKWDENLHWRFFLFFLLLTD